MTKSSKIYIILIAASIYAILLFFLFYAELINKHSSISSLTDAFWYSIETLTPVKYGGSHIVTGVGRFIGLIFVLISVGVLGFFIGTLVTKINNRFETRRLGLMGTKFNNHIVIIGWDKFGQQGV